MKIRIIEDCLGYKKGEIAEVENVTAHRMMDFGKVVRVEAAKTTGVHVVLSVNDVLNNEVN